MQKIYKIGVIGLGDISTVYLNNLRKYPQYVELYACACRSLEKAEQKAKQFDFSCHIEQHFRRFFSWFGV